MAEKIKYDLYSQDYYRHSHAVLARIRQEEPVLHQPGIDGKTPIWFITTARDVDTVLRNDRVFSLDWRRAADPAVLEQAARAMGVWEMVNRHLLTLEGEDHRRLRTLVSKAFTPRMINDMRPRIQAIADQLLDEVQGQGTMDLVDQYAFPLPIAVIAEMLGIPYEDRHKFRVWSDAFVTPALTPEDNARASGHIMDFVSYLSALFEQRRADPRNDLVSALLQAEEQGDRLSMPELFSMVVLLIVAGHETTVTLIGNATLALLQHPELADHLRQHPEQMPEAVEEFLRYDSPVERAVTRFVTEDFELGGKLLRRGDLVIVVLASANRDERQHEQPDQLDIHRENKNHLAFGRGVHYCLGAPLARMEAEIALNTLLRRLPNLRLAVAVEELTYRQVPLFHSLKSLPVTF
jgi:cytochrome P450